MPLKDDAVREGGKEEDDLNHLLEELSQKIKTQTEIVKEELRKYGKRWLGERYVLWYLFHGRDEIVD